MLENVKQYYGKVLQSSADLKTDACCTPAGLPQWVKAVLTDIHEEVQSRYYGCGLVMPQLLEGCRILDLGSGSGRDCYMLAKLVGAEGSVVGVDMTEEQLAVARRHQDWHAKRFGHETPNTDFRFGYIEKLSELGLEPASFDVIISNCVINLSPDKEAVLKGAFDLLKPGGELYFSDTYSDRRIPQDLVEDPVLHGECLSGALYWNDFLSLAKKSGFIDPRLVEDRPLSVGDEDAREKVEPIRFYSATYRLFKLEDLDAGAEDYGQAVIYKGTVPHSEGAFHLDKDYTIEKGRVFPVCGNTYRMLNESRFKDHFEFLGTRDTHFGIFPGCGKEIPFSDSDSAVDEGNSGCC